MLSNLTTKAYISVTEGIRRFKENTTRCNRNRIRFNRRSSSYSNCCSFL